MTESVKVGDRVTHFRYGQGIVERMVSHGLVEVRFGAALQYVDQRSLLSLDGQAREAKARRDRERQKSEFEKIAARDAKRLVIKNKVIAYLDGFDYETADSVYQERCREWWPISDYQVQISRAKAAQAQKVAEEEARNILIARKKIKRSIRGLLESGKFDEADLLYKRNCVDWWSREAYEEERLRAIYMYRFVSMYRDGSLADLDALFKDRQKIVEFTSEDFAFLKLPKLRNRLAAIGIKLDEEQERANARPEHRILIKARAGSGKTRALCARAVLAIRDEQLMPNQVMILAFNKSAATEVKHRIQEVGKIPNFDNARTFHSLAYQLVKPRKKILFDAGGHPSLREQSRFVQQMMQRILNPAFKEAMVEFFRAELEQIEDIGRDLAPQEYMRFRRSLEYITLRGERVKSKGEKFIADFLFEHGIEYRYERAWDWKSDIMDGSVYRPDFSIVANGCDYILEHWAIDPSDRSAELPAHWDTSTELYRHQILRKREFWLAKGAPLLETHVGLLCEGRKVFENRLKKILERSGIRCQKRPLEEIVSGVFANDFSISRMAELFLQFIQRAKKRGWSVDYLAKHISVEQEREPMVRLFHDLALRAYREYELMLSEQEAMDFDDLLVQAVEEVETKGSMASIHLGQGRMINISQIKWILLDEFQDFSELYFRMLNAIVKANPEIRLVAVGDDWQAINAFAGAELRFFERFSEYFPGAVTVEVTTNYRSKREIVAAGNCLMDGRGSPAKVNSDGLGRIEVKDICDEWIEFRKGDEFTERRELDEVYLTPGFDRSNPSDADLRLAKALKLCVKIIREEPAKKTLILARTGNVYGIDLLEFRRRLVSILAGQLGLKPDSLDKNVIAMTAHGSKGQQAHRVVILDVTSRQFPKIHPDNLLFGLFGVTPLSVLDEERRLFYVAITRAEHCLYLLTEKGCESPYLDGIKNPLTHRVERGPLVSATNRLGGFASLIKSKISKFDSSTEDMKSLQAQDVNRWDFVRINVSSRFQSLVSALEALGVAAPETEYVLPGEDDLIAEMAWPDASPPVAILAENQMQYLGEWKSRGWRVPGPELSIEKVVSGVRYYVHGKKPASAAQPAGTPKPN